MHLGGSKERVNAACSLGGTDGTEEADFGMEEPELISVNGDTGSIILMPPDAMEEDAIDELSAPQNH